MKTFQSHWLKVFIVITITTFFAACGKPPTPDKTLAPPIIQKPIYNCAEIIAFSGVSRDSTIIVYVNGKEVTSRKTWLGWGSIKLPLSLKKGDVVSAVQVVNNRISSQTREPVTVIDIPSHLKPGGDLNSPTIVPPIYECQQVVIVKNVLEGSTVDIRNWDADEWSGMTPGNHIRLFRPEVRLEEKWFNAFQKICKDPPITSDWSKKVWVQKKPSSLPEPKLREPFELGNDACIVDNLTPGAKVDIYAEIPTSSVRVGGGIAAAESGTIFKIDPPFNKKYKYRPTQSLCDIQAGAKGISPVEKVPQPTVKQPVCDGEIYVTICNTAVLSTVKVYADGTQVTEGAGNGECVTLALGNKYKFSKGQKITVQQFVAGKPGPMSASVTVETGVPTYNPAYWNDSFHIERNNCYAYACDIRGETKHKTKQQPGRAHGIHLSPPVNCFDVANGAIADGLKKNPEKQCKGCTHLVVLAISPGDKPGESNDYHWYRLDNNGRWSHKPGWKKATDLDASGKQIINPETADRKYVGPDYTLDYRILCTYYCVDKKVVVIK